MSTQCVKCEEGKAIILVGTNGSFCKECFLKYFTHKFRAALGKHPVVRYDDKVAVAFSGGLNSSAMLHVLLESLSPLSFKRLKFHPGIVFVDETVLLPEEKNYEIYLNEIESIMKASGLPYHIVKLEEILSIIDDTVIENNDDTAQTCNLRELFDSIKSITSKQELLYRLRCKLLTYKAKELGYQHIFLGETSSRLAINILSNIAQGQGAHLSLDTGFTDNGRYLGINLLRPLRDIGAKEIAVYTNINKIQSVFLPNFSTKVPATSSIQRLTEDFIVSLTSDFPATETTVYRTSNKLEMMKNSKKEENKDTNENCFLCCGPLDTQIKEDNASALQAIEFTENLSNGIFGTAENPHLPHDLKSTSKLPQSDSGDDYCETQEKTMVNLCHSCKILHKDVNTEVNFDPIFEHLFKNSSKVTNEEMRKQLEDVLLDS
uniref:cytoplasmic tRNA 2-thiolation protein 2-like n=1 Tax=Styela clava TaxID=7725 RepID=UPI00193AD6DB|nr:cytoplasmic tRNA 2-thiolation protein 2-like [Styela clava]